MKSFRSIGLAVALTVASACAQAQQYEEVLESRPSSGAMAFDLLVVRPLALAGTVAGVGLFVLNLPLSIAQGEPPAEPARRFIVEPARYTFVRELGKIE